MSAADLTTTASNCAGPSLRLSSGFKDTHWISAIATPLLVDLTGSLSWGCDIATLEGLAMVVRDTTYPIAPLSINHNMVGRHLPVLQTAMGIAYLAFAPPTERKLLLGMMPRSGVPADAMTREPERVDHLIAEAQRRGYALRQGGSNWPANQRDRAADPTRQARGRMLRGDLDGTHHERQRRGGLLPRTDATDPHADRAEPQGGPIGEAESVAGFRVRPREARGMSGSAGRPADPAGKSPTSTLARTAGSTPVAGGRTTDLQGVIRLTFVPSTCRIYGRTLRAIPGFGVMIATPIPPNTPSQSVGGELPHGGWILHMGIVADACEQNRIRIEPRQPGSRHHRIMFTRG